LGSYQCLFYLDQLRIEKSETAMSGRGFIALEPDQVCELCGIIAECRPYGPNDEQVCFDCAMKDEKTAERKMAAYIFGETDGQSN
jgi:hypothetical protein